MRKYFLLCLTIFIIGISILIPIKGQAMYLIPDKIRVGLYYDSSARSSYQLYSGSGFRVGFTTDLSVISLSDKLLEVYSANSTDFVPKKNNIRDKNIAMEYASQLAQMGIESYLLFDDDWSVWTRSSNKTTISSDFDLVVVKGDSQNPGLIFPITMDKPIFLASNNMTSPITIEGRQYRGILEMALISGKSIQVVNELGLDEYLYGVVPGEMPPSWHMEALKAQAVAARTYAVANLSKWKNYGFDVDASPSDQLYGGYDVEDARTNQAVDETKGQIIIYDENPITAFYHADSGGRTEACRDVFGLDLPYLQPVDDIVDVNSPYSNWEIHLSSDDISERAKAVMQSVGEINEVSIIENTSAGRVKKLLVKGKSGEAIIENSNIRSVLQLKSNFFNISGGSKLDVVSITGDGIKKNVKLNGKNIIAQEGLSHISTGYASIAGANLFRNINLNTTDNTYIFYGHGYGHGVGMSQWGAKAMAENGYNYTEILSHYYTDVEIAL
ncbi:SpoIID/LytB domain protein [Tepidanaerobacter acetatoxydans Re1]|uniref:SpoIID/LytB domain protein n=1 Tax=Tepidanaerobacter acetatoxydans (strain DSM 21804 / JCM 16047 / Re1) TaxID=1209989 RepID=F4LTJ1_TEPAE|nr:SpoIID/LytB domain-containing protein [Tepidanaerobacter acetatoxydans]AEE91321.1 SpoIID/LytB domain protein [Tepidanaerobacter acetatoxydans Re1]CCP26009.1 SpoIID/LytB domain protein [Tepidanaerobacter acetatoxydans Re1]